MGDSSFIAGDQVEYTQVLEENDRLRGDGKIEAHYERQLLGITKASLPRSPSFLLHHSRKQHGFLQRQQ